MRISKKYRLIVLLSVILFAAFISLSFINYKISTKSITTEIVNSSLPLMRENIYSEIQKILTPPINIASLMANDSFLKNWTLAGEKEEDSVIQYLNEIKNKYGYFSAFFVSAKTGKYYHYSGIHKIISPEDGHDVWFYRFVDSGADYDLDVDVDEASDNRLTIFINYRIEDFNGNLLGVTGVGLEMENFSSFLKKKEEKYHRHIFLVNHDGVIQAHQDTSLIETANISLMPGIRDVAPLLLSAELEPVDDSYQTDHGRVLITSRYVPEIDWFVIVEQEEAAALSGARHTLWRTLAIGLLTSLVIITLSAFTVNRFQQRLERMASTDELTGLYNRREFDSRFEAAVSRFKRFNTPISLIILDIDHFKEINDSVGHLTGDKVLIAVTQLISESVRPGDVVARWGGDEFVILLECGVEEAGSTAERLRILTLTNVSAAFHGEVGEISLSLGAAEYVAGDTIETLTIKADKALYISKNKGRNRTTVYSEA